MMLAACSEQAPVARFDHAAVADWRVTIELPEASLPVSLHLAPDGSEAWFTNGAERVLVPEVGRDAGGWTLHFPAFNNTVRLQETADGFGGSLTLVKRGYEQHMDLVAVPGQGHRFVEAPVPSVDVTGRWEVEFVEDDGAAYAAIGEFDQQGGRLTGTFLTAKGDYRYLAGEVDGATMYLSTFDGAHAFVFSAAVLGDGSLQGDFWSGTRWHESWTARRNFDAKLPDAHELTYLVEGYEQLDFSFPDLEGNRVSPGDDKYRGKVLLVTLGGSWCPNCADQMDLLAAYYQATSSRGLEIITLLYEHFEEFDTAAQLGRALVEKHRIGFDVLVAGSSDKAAAAETLPMLNHVLAFPTIIFIDREGKVRRIHTGFSGPGTGRHYQEFKREFGSFVDSLLAEDVAPANQKKIFGE